MSKERALRRAEREREAAIRTAARAAQAERRERRARRRLAVRRATVNRVPRLVPAGRPQGVLARRRRVRVSLLLAGLLAANVLVWVVRSDWPTRLAALVLTLLVGPVAAALVRPGRR